MLMFAVLPSSPYEYFKGEKADRHPSCAAKPFFQHLHRINPVVDLRAVLLDALRSDAVRAADLRVEVRAFAPGA